MHSLCYFSSDNGHTTVSNAGLSSSSAHFNEFITSNSVLADLSLLRMFISVSIGTFIHKMVNYII